MYLFTVRPLSIQLIGENRPLSADVSVHISCQVTGAKPPPIVTWWKDNTQLTDAKQTVSYCYIHRLFLMYKKM